MDYASNHLDQPLNLSILAQAAHLSPYHFHRIFSLLVGETPADFVQRIRIEKAAYLLGEYKDISINEVAHKCGFGSGSVFSRIFRKHFGMKAKEFREVERAILVKNGVRYSKNGQLLSKNSQLSSACKPQLCDVELKQLTIMSTKVEIKDMPEMKVVYCRHMGQFNEIYKAYGKVMAWAGAKGLLNFPVAKTVTVYHDDPSVTDIEKVRQDACVTVEGDVKVNGEIGKMTIPAGRYAVGRFEIGVTEFEKAWNTMCMWFTESGYQPGEGCTYELYHNDHNEHPEKKFILDICIPVKLL